MKLELKCIRKDEDSDNVFVSFRTQERLQLFGAEVRVKLVIDKEHISKFNPDRYKIGEIYPVEIEL